MGKQRLLLLVLVLFTLPVLGGCSADLPDFHPRAEAGKIDLTQIQLENDVVLLDGEWEFYAEQLLTPDQADSNIAMGYIHVPRSWNHYKLNGEELSGFGYATYRLLFSVSEQTELSLKIPRIHTSYELRVNGELKASAGTLGTTRETTTPQYLPQVASFEAQAGQNEIIIQVANFHQRSGGILESIKISSESQIIDQRYQQMAREILLFAALFFMGAYHLAVFFFRRKDKSPLYFGGFCLLLGIRTLLVGDSFFTYLYPDFSWEIAHKIQTLTFYLGTPLITMFFASVAPKLFHTPVVRLTQFAGAGFGLLVLFTPVRIFSIVNPIYQIGVIFLIIYLLAVLLKACFSGEKGYFLLTGGTLAVTLTVVHDILFHSIWRYDSVAPFLNTLFTTGNLSSAGQIIFAFVNSLLLAKRFADALEREEVTTTKLTEINTTLDALVLQRTKSLAESNEKIKRQKTALKKANRTLRQFAWKDSLTGIWNRRKYDETVPVELSRCIRDQKPLALILVDIDYFKEFNDAYGHMPGDQCLIQVGQTIAGSLGDLGGMAARYGGDEFMVLLPGADKDRAIETADAIWRKISELRIPHKDSPISDHVTVSIGVTSVIPDPGASRESLFELVDGALYQAKSAGRNRVVFLKETTHA